ncbi:GNAT family N-acetyltransferase [Alphaproteobacteria bacterium]|nr:GNAT family N-acetyltransferase [Alphaproteobacteria bacterium]
MSDTDLTSILGPLVPDWQPPPSPFDAGFENGGLIGNHVTLVPLDADQHAAGLFTSFAEDKQDSIWHYLPYGPFDTLAEYTDYVRKMTASGDVFFFAIQDNATRYFVGVASYLRINPTAGSIEVGHLCFAPALQATIGATEAMFMMMQWAFNAGYRRYEWKCNARNLRSRRAAQRLGFSYEGLFRQALVTKGHNRDTAWFATIDAEWPALKQAFTTWLDMSNFDAEGCQYKALSDMTASVLVAHDPALT